MPFMQLDIQCGGYYLIETRDGTSLVPDGVVSVDLESGWNDDLEEWSSDIVAAFADYVEGDISPNDSIEHKAGWYGRYSAPGYMDCTEWSWADSEEELRSELEDMYGESDDSHEYEVIVGNVGSVHSGNDADDAQNCFNQYVTISTQDSSSRAFGESVTLMCDGDIEEEHIGTVNESVDPIPQAGYAFRFDDLAGTWDDSSDENWDTLVIPDSALQNPKFIGTRTIDGSVCNVWFSGVYFAQVKLS